MSTLGGWSSADEQQTFIRLERWLVSIFGRKGLTAEEMLVGQGLIMDHRRALGLPLLPQPGTRPTEEEIEAGRIGGLRLVPK